MIDAYGPRSFTRAPRPVTAPGPDRIAIQTPAAWPGTHRRGMFLPDDRCPGEAGSLAAPEHRVQRRSRGPELGRERRPLAGPPGGPRARALRALVAPVGDHGFARTHRPQTGRGRRAAGGGGVDPPRAGSPGPPGEHRRRLLRGARRRRAPGGGGVGADTRPRDVDPGRLQRRGPRRARARRRRVRARLRDVGLHEPPLLGPALRSRGLHHDGDDGAPRHRARGSGAPGRRPRGAPPRRGGRRRRPVRGERVGGQAPPARRGLRASAGPGRGP